MQMVLYKHRKLLMVVGKNTFTIMQYYFLGFFLVNRVFALLLQKLGMFEDFDFAAYQSDTWFLYLPGELNQWRLVTLATGIGVSLGLALLLKGIHRLELKLFSCPGKSILQGRACEEKSVNRILL